MKCFTNIKPSMRLIIIFFYNVIFNGFLFERLFLRNPSVAIENLNKIQQDFSNIYFPINFSIDSNFLVLILSLLVTLLINSAISSKSKIDSAEKILEEFIKIFFIYSFTLFSFMYLLRLYSFSRGLLILGIVFYSFSTYLFLLILRFIENKYDANRLTLKILIAGFLGIIVFNSLNNNQTNLAVSSVENHDNTSLPATISTTTTLFLPEIITGDCFEWLGSNNYFECRNELEINSKSFFSDSVNNIVVYEEDFYVLDVRGIIFKNSKDNIFIDIQPKVLNRLDRDPDEESTGEAGLFSLAFHPDENYALISYSDLEDNLVVEKYFLDEKYSPLEESSLIIFKVPNSVGYHYSGNLIWSNYFQDFLLSVGDMNSNYTALANSEPFDTTSPRGKILLVEKEITTPVLMSLEKNVEPKKNIIAYGLRNPWKTFEYKNYLFVPDIGFNSEEELNVLDLKKVSDSKSPFLLGWPYFEGTINNEVNFNTILLHENNQSSKINDFIINNSIKPIVYYSHNAPNVIRAAIIGGGVIEDKNSEYYENYIFADFLSRELFAYDFVKNQLSIFPLGDLDSFITSVAIHPNKFDTILISTGSGNIIEIGLP